MDNASTTKVDPEVLNTMLPYFTEYYGNPSSIHAFGREARKAVDTARTHVGDLLGAKDDEIIFTAGGTESDNLAIKGVAYLNKDKRTTKGPHIITSTIEHPGVLETCRHLETQGFQVKYLPVDKDGIVNPEELQKSISKNTFLITIMFANNEIGTIQPIEEIGKIAHKHDIIFHTDAVQAVAKLPIDVKKQHIDLLALSSHKIYGPKGIGALYIRNGVKVQPIIHGGGHEKGVRSSTLNVPGIVGLGKACDLAEKRMTKDIPYMKTLRDLLIKNTLQIEESHLNGHPEKRLVNNAHFRFTGIEGESILLGLDEQGIATSTGSACSSQKLQASHVLLAIGLDPVQAHGSLRMSLGRENTKEEVTYVSKIIPQIVEKLRMMSPLWNR
ncbi:MAG: cysteine desulfurase NifS [Thermoplasmata archaeon]|nr:cysteine desulfurase NifS [Thermoplasmata archaeon]MBE3137323.1 cysteine desulfurase NifS [Thermoplasmata archaeon]